MNHPTDDELLLLAYAELPGPRAAEIEAHLAACRGCGATLAELERGRVALDVARLPRRREQVDRGRACGCRGARGGRDDETGSGTRRGGALDAHDDVVGDGRVRDRG